MRLYVIDHLSQMKDDVAAAFAGHKTLMLVSVGISIFAVVFGVFAMRVRERMIAGMQSLHKDASTQLSYLATESAFNPNLVVLHSPDTAILGASNDADTVSAGTDESYPTPTPFPLVTLAPLPTRAPIVVAPAAPISSCTGTPTSDNSQVYVSSSTSLVGNAVTITIDLLDCHNTYAPVNDTLTVTLQSGDSGTQINGASSPVTVQAQNGKTTFSVNSQNSTTDTFVIVDTSRSFTVTTPGYHNPTVTFSNNTSRNAHCTTAAGVPNAWYSDVYPASPVTTDVGAAATFTVYIRDCNQNTAQVADTLNITLTSGDPTTRINGNNPTYVVTTQNGQTSFTVTSQNTGTNAITVQDATSSFTVTDPNNHNPSVTFTSSPTPAPTDTTTPMPTVTNTPAQTGALTPTSSTTPASSVSGTPSL